MNEGDLWNDIDSLVAESSETGDTPFAAGAALEELASAIAALGCRGLDRAVYLMGLLHIYYSENRVCSYVAVRLGAIVADIAVSETSEGVSQADVARAADLLLQYVAATAQCAASPEFRGIYNCLEPLLLPLTATSVLLHAYKAEDTQLAYYECPSLWIVLTLLDSNDVISEGNSQAKTASLSPRELLDSFIQFCLRSRCVIAHAVIAAFRYLVSYSAMPNTQAGIQVTLLHDPGKRINRAVDIMKSKFVLVYAYILGIIDRTALTSASKSVDGPLPVSLDQYVQTLIPRLKKRYEQLFTVPMVKPEKPLRPVKPIIKNNRGGRRFKKHRKVILNREQVLEQGDI